MNPNEETISNLCNKVADIKYETQQVLDRLYSLDGVYQERTGREESLTKLVKELEAMNENLAVDNSNLEKELQRQQDLGQGYYDSMMTFKQQLDEAKTNMALMTDELERLKADKERLTGLEIQLRDKIRDLKSDVNGLEQPETIVIPKDVAIAIFREGVQSGINDAVAELEGQTINIEESEYYGHFEVSFSKSIELDEELDLDWMRDKVGQYNEEFVVDALKGLCASKELQCTIEGLEEDKPNVD
jgi:predicted RNase H-like nuclease (RuvC/YqgF family)